MFGDGAMTAQTLDLGDGRREEALIHITEGGHTHVAKLRVTSDVGHAAGVEPNHGNIDPVVRAFLGNARSNGGASDCGATGF